MSTGKSSGSGSRVGRLQFKQRLLSPSAKQISTPELLKRLKSLFGEISRTEQEEIEVESLRSVTRDLIHSSLIKHKDRGVKAYVACCVSDLLRLYAPDAPYTDYELRNIFDLFVRQLQNIGNINGPYYDLYFHLLENLARVKIVLLILDLQNHEELLIELFRNIFDVIRQGMSTVVHSHMVDILEQLINDSQEALPQEVIEIILAQFLKKRKDENPAAYKLASEVCKASTDKLQRYICQYFTDVIVAAGKSGAPAEELNDFKTAHDLIKELNRIAPGLLLNVIPQLEEELKLDDLNLRMLATQVLGEMFSEKNSTLASRYDNVWKMWLLRRNDKIADVRCAWTEYCLPIYINHHELAKQINEAIISKMSDPDDKVRITVCKVFSQLEYECASKLVEKELFVELAKRCRDRKHGVRQEAIKALARLYNLAYMEIVDHDANAIEKFGWIPSEILNTLYTNDNEIIACVEKALHDEILSPSNDDSIRMERLLIVFESLDAKAKKGFFSLFQRQRDVINDMNAYLSLCERYKEDMANNDSENFTNVLNQVVQRISDKLPDPLKSANHLSSFPKLYDSDVYKMIRDCMNPLSDWKTVKKSAEEVLKRIEQNSNSSLETFSILIRRISMAIINRDLVPLLVSKIKSSDSNVAHELFQDISSRFPVIFKPHLDELKKSITDNENPLIVEDSLQAFSKLSIASPDEIPQDREFVRRFMDYALEGSPRQAKFAAIILGHVRYRENICRDLLNEIIPKLSLDTPHLLANLSALSQCVFYSPETFDEKEVAITDFILMLLTTNAQHTTQESNIDWIDDDELSDEFKAKVLGLKVLVNRLLAPKAAADLAKKVFKLLWTLIREGGELLKDKSTSLSLQSRLRLAAMRSVLKLATQEIYDSMISIAEFQELALMIQDSCYQVRLAFASRLVKYCGGHRLSSRYLSIFFLIAHDPMNDIREMVKVFLIRQSREKKIIRNRNSVPIEMSLVRLIYILSHHPDFSREPKVLSEFVVYIDFFLETIANSENISFLLHISGRLKQVNDEQSLDQCENLCTLSDITQYLIRAKSKANSWALPAYPGQVELPSDLFKNLSSPEVIAETMKKNYIPNEFLKELEKTHSSTHHKSEKHKANKKSRKKSSASQSSSKRRKVGADAPETSQSATRKTAPRAAKSKIKSMADNNIFSEEHEDESDEMDESP
ncbi:hypothetical protein Glove_330g114 [Diversispora epigaea]|uniref:Uncharacterized protein n=1 Tax=Diversispora epigaea TaxID=1348612 RepID=A0A397HJL9_9GLOM|nr:hypothetical protein Glove_330g114 [Diversispora epigaea]